LHTANHSAQNSHVLAACSRVQLALGESKALTQQAHCCPVTSRQAKPPAAGVKQLLVQPGQDLLLQKDLQRICPLQVPSTAAGSTGSMMLSTSGKRSLRAEAAQPQTTAEQPCCAELVRSKS
jgi:hypothetical protein